MKLLLLLFLAMNAVSALDLIEPSSKSTFLYKDLKSLCPKGEQFQMDSASDVLDESSCSITIPTLTLCKKSYNKASVTTNGAVNLGSQQAVDYEISSFPYKFVPDRIAPLWADLILQHHDASIWYEVFEGAHIPAQATKYLRLSVSPGFNPKHVVVVTWNKLSAFDSNENDPNNTFQMVWGVDAHLASVVAFLYKELSDIQESTIGWQGPCLLNHPLNNAQTNKLTRDSNAHNDGVWVYSISNKQTEQSCKDNGVVYKHGDKWKRTECISCVCDNGQATCAGPRCFAPCPNPIKVPGKCCPVCPGKTCKDNGIVYQNGESWKRNGCVSCTCRDGSPACVGPKCPKLPCPSPVKVPGECCLVCTRPPFCNPIKDLYCKHRPNGNYAWTDKPNYYIACSNGLTHCMPCATSKLVFVEKCNKCLYPGEKCPVGGSHVVNNLKCNNHEKSTCASYNGFFETTPKHLSQYIRCWEKQCWKQSCAKGTVWKQTGEKTGRCEHH